MESFALTKRVNTWRGMPPAAINRRCDAVKICAMTLNVTTLAPLAVTRIGVPCSTPSATPSKRNSSSPARPSDSMLCPRSNARGDAHADQVGAMDALERFGDHRVHAESAVPLAAQSRLLPVP